MKTIRILAVGPQGSLRQFLEVQRLDDVTGFSITNVTETETTIAINRAYASDVVMVLSGVDPCKVAIDYDCGLFQLRPDDAIDCCDAEDLPGACRVFYPEPEVLRKNESIPPVKRGRAAFKKGRAAIKEGRGVTKKVRGVPKTVRARDL